MPRDALSWREDLAVSIPSIDRDHQQIINRAAVLYEAVLALRGTDDLLPLISDLLSVTEAHFAAEEQLMLANSYPEYEAHHKDHEWLLEQLRLVKQDIESNTIRPTGLMALFFENWTEQHIVTVDKALAEFLRNADCQSE